MRCKCYYGIPYNDSYLASNGYELPPNFDYFSTIPTLLQARIIEHAGPDAIKTLGRWARVNSEWNKLAKNDVLWKVLTIRKFSDEKIDKAKWWLKSQFRLETWKTIYEAAFGQSVRVVLPQSLKEKNSMELYFVVGDTLKFSVTLNKLLSEGSYILATLQFNSGAGWIIKSNLPLYSGDDVGTTKDMTLTEKQLNVASYRLKLECREYDKPALGCEAVGILQRIP